MYYSSDDPRATSRSLVADTLCKLYALGLVVLGIIFPTSRLLATKESAVLADRVYDGFHVYLCSVGILFILFMFVFLVRRVSHFDESELQDGGPQDDIELRGMPRAESTATVDTLQIAKLDNLEINRRNTKEYGNTLKVPNNPSNRGRSLSVSALDIPVITYGDFGHRRADSVVTILSETSTLPSEGTVPPATILRHGEASYPNFYVRVGAILFGIGSLVTWGIDITNTTEWILRCSLPVPILDMVKWGLQAVFTALQLHFIFKYSKISINRFKVICRFGIMHLLATNLNIWIHIIVEELNPSVETKANRNLTFEETFMGMEVISPEVKACIANISGGSMLTTASHFLFPLVIEFSLIGAVSFYNIYENIGLMQKIRHKRRRSREQSSVSSTVLHFPHHQAVNVTCHKSYKGAFVGVVMAAITVISCVVYNRLETPGGNNEIPGEIFFFTETALLAMAVVGVCHALCKIRSLSILRTYKKGPDETLLMIAAVGVYTFEFYTLYAYVGASSLEPWMQVAGAASGCLALVQTTLQVMFVFDGLRRQTATTKLLRRKPGREAVVFLLLLNLALWMLYSFEIYGGLYQIMSSIDPKKANEYEFMMKLCKPLFIFFRFHSTTCLYEIWKNSYKLKKSTGE